MEANFVRINSGAYPYQTPAQKTGTSSGASGGISFGKQLDIAARRSADQREVRAPGAAWQDGGIHMLSPYCQLMDRYDAWKARQPAQVLPDSWGATEENLAYLKERYTGDLSWEERVDALETMQQLGVITADQKHDALGLQTRALNINDWDHAMKVIAEDMKKAMDEDYAYLRGGWNACFRDRPIGTFKTADDLFAWLDKTLESENT